ncbi:unnamed protein product [Calypogeia fissa]
MAQALRSKIGSILLRRAPQQQVVSKRAFSSGAGSPAQKHEDMEEAVKWRNVTIAGYVLCTLLAVYNFAGGHPEEEERKEYSYMRIRNKEFPWGPDGLLEYKHEHH